MKSAGSSVEVALLPHCGPDDISTGTGYVEELESKEYNYFEQNNTKVVKILHDDEALNYLKQKRIFSENNHYTCVELTDRRYTSHTTDRMIQNDSEDCFKATKDYYKVSIIRNPYEALVSYFWWVFYEPKILGDSRNNNKKYSPITMPHMAPLPSDSIEILQQKFQLFLESPAIFKTPYRKYSKKMTIFEWFSEWQCEFYVGIDYLMRYENLQDEYNTLCKKLGITAQLLPRLKSTQRKSKLSHKFYYNDVTREMIFEGFKEIIQQYNF